MLSCDDWVVVSYAVTSLAVFGAAVPATYQQILPKCLPPHRLGLFQARVQGQIWDGSTMTRVSPTNKVGRLAAVCRSLTRYCCNSLASPLRIYRSFKTTTFNRTGCCFPLPETGTTKVNYVLRLPPLLPLRPDHTSLKCPLKTIAKRL